MFSDLYGASLGLVAGPWGVTTHAVRVIIVFSCANYFLLGRIGGALASVLQHASLLVFF